MKAPKLIKRACDKAPCLIEKNAARIARVDLVSHIENNIAIAAVDNPRIKVVWAKKEVSLLMSNPALIGDTLFGLSERSSGQFLGLDAKTGKALWLGQPREASNTAVVKAGDLLFLLNDDAELIVARSSQAGIEPLKRYTVADSAT